MPTMDKLTPRLTEQQLKENIDALDAQGAPHDFVQKYIDNYSKNYLGGGYILKSEQNKYGYSDPRFIGRAVWQGLTKGFAPEAPPFPATPNEGTTNPAWRFVKGGAKLLGNLPTGILNLGKGIVNFASQAVRQIPQDIRSIGESVHTLGQARQQLGSWGAVAKEGAKGMSEIAGKAAHTIFVQPFVEKIMKGDLEGARQELVNHSGEQIGYYLLMAKQAANAMGQGKTFDNAMTTITNPVVNAVAKPFQALGHFGALVGRNVLGVTTGAGSVPVEMVGKEGFTQGFQPTGEAPTGQVEGMRGEIDPEHIVDNFRTTTAQMAETASKAYRSRFAEIEAKNPQSFDISPIIEKYQENLKNFGIADDEGNVPLLEDGKTIDFSNASRRIQLNKGAQENIQYIYNTMKSFGTKTGDRTINGLDDLKQGLDEIYDAKGPARAFVQSMKNVTRNLLNENVDNYEEMTADYSKAKTLELQIKNAIGTDPAKPPNIDLILKRITRAVQGDDAFKYSLLKTLADNSDSDLISQAAGYSMSNIIPKGLVAKLAAILAGEGGLIAGHFNLASIISIIPALIAASPRLVGEFLHAAGLASGTATRMANLIADFKVPAIPAPNISNFGVSPTMYTPMGQSDQNNQNNQ